MISFAGHWGRQSWLGRASNCNRTRLKSCGAGRASTVSVRDRRRSELVLLSAEGLTQQQIADHPTHRGITAQPLGIVHVLVAGQPPKHRLAQRPRQPVATVLAGACVRERSSPRVGQAQRVIQLAVI